MSDTVRKVVIVGGGLAGWLCAARLSHAMRGRALDLRVVRAAPPGVEVDPLDEFCASTLSSLPVTHAELGIDERAFMRATDATFKLATEFQGFGPRGGGYLLPFGEIGARLEAVGFHQLIGRLEKSGQEFSLDDYSVPSLAARLGRFAHPTRDARSVLSTYEYAWHVDTRAYTQLLRAFAVGRGVVAIDETLARCETAAGDIRAVILGGGARLEADLFVDCTGVPSRLLGEALQVSFESWRHWLPCDAAVSVREPANPDLPSCTRVRAQRDGWSLHVPLRSATLTSFFHDSRAGSAPPAPAATGERAPELRFENGARRQAWRGNCVAIGAAAGFVEPLASTGLRLIDEPVARLVQLFPASRDMRLLAAEFNREMAILYDSARDFVLLHYVAGQRDDGPLWRGRETPLPASLAHFLELFRHRGRISFEEEGLFEEAWWACACHGLGVRQSRFGILAEQSREADLQAQVAKIARVMRSAVEQLPPHRTYLQRYLG